MTTGPALRCLVYAAVALLVAIGVVAGIARTVYLDDLGRRAEPVRLRALETRGVVDPRAAQRALEVAVIDDRFASHRAATLLHVLAGTLFLGLAPLQFSSRIRGRYIALHRWSGRLLLVTGILTTIAGMYFGVLMPFAGVPEAIVIGLVGTFFLFAISTAFMAIRRRDVARHRAWMIRAFAVAMGISTVRLVSIPLDLAMTSRGFSTRTIFVLSLWLGWILTAAGAEVWLAYTRRTAKLAPAPVGVAEV
ncbi:MAG: DUF2306 domain-containing protein [Vicinamibacterales bacterium]